MEEKIYSSNQLINENACEVLKKHNIPVNGSKNEGTAYAVLIKDLIKEYFEGKIAKEDIKAELAARIEDIGFKKGQKEMKINDGWNYIHRYICSEKRKPIIPTSAVINLQGKIKVQLCPDFIFITPEGDVEAVKIRVSLAKNSGITKKSILGVQGLELYTLSVYAREWYKSQYGKEPASVTGAYYFLRKNYDRLTLDPSKQRFDADFWAKCENDNVFSVSSKNVPGKKNDLDSFYSEYVDAFIRGLSKEECQNECGFCQFNQICNYTHPPKAEIKEKKIRSLNDLTLTEAQDEVVELDDGIIRVNAGPGAGKTLVLVLRVVSLLNKGAKPSEIALFTFTNTGAEEMRERIALYNEDFGSGEDISDMIISTFNAYGDSILKKEYSRFGFTREPSVIDDVQRSIIIANLLNNEELIDGLDYRNFSMNMRYVKGALGMVKDIFDIIKKNQYTEADIPLLQKEYGKSNDIYIGGFTDESYRRIMALYSKYDNELKKKNLIEFADQEILLNQLLKQDPYYFDNLGIKHIIVDEFQDTSMEEMEILQYFRQAPSFESLMVVGDDSQSIFGFRNTSPEFLINFFQTFPCSAEEKHDIYLLDNHRSTPEIVDFANKLNDRNKNKVEKQLKATREHGKKPIAMGFHNKTDEYDFLSTEIAKQYRNGNKSIAFIAQSKPELLKMADLLTTMDIPSVLMNPEQYISNSRVMAALSLASAFRDANDTLSILNCINAEIGGNVFTVSDDKIAESIKKHRDEIMEIMKMPDIVQKAQFLKMLERYDENDEVYQSFCESLSRLSSMKEILSYCEKYVEYGSSNAVRRVNDYPGVVLTTAHSSKGLEWNTVYCSVDNFHKKGLVFKSYRNQDLDQAEEARRLFFVTVTRARDELVITGQYVAHGDRKHRVYNQFLKEAYEILGKEFNIQTIEAEAELIAEKKKKEAMSELMAG